MRYFRKHSDLATSFKSYKAIIMKDNFKLLIPQSIRNPEANLGLYLLLIRWYHNIKDPQDQYPEDLLLKKVKKLLKDKVILTYCLFHQAYLIKLSLFSCPEYGLGFVSCIF